MGQQDLTDDLPQQWGQEVHFDMNGPDQLFDKQ